MVHGNGKESRGGSTVDFRGASCQAKLIRPLDPSRPQTSMWWVEMEGDKDENTGKQIQRLRIVDKVI